MNFFWEYITAKDRQMKLRDPTKPVVTPAIGKKYVILFWITHTWVRYPEENAFKERDHIIYTIIFNLTKKNSG